VVVVGDEDIATPYPKAQKIHFAIKGSKFAVIKGSGHSTPVEQPELLNEVLEEFLQSIAG
ncbi:alpha/beta hydrolase, partial [Leptospira borgpetersenii serovar Balcanica]|nr:alpha/beta hydrolase [Leptospira borgpetersenii serovar Balcanica]